MKWRTPPPSESGCDMTTTSLSDRAVSTLRTVVPAVWGSLVALLLGWVAPHLPGDLGQRLADVLGGEATVTLVVTATITIWYALWRQVEPRIPDWLTRIVLGSAASPSYSPEADVVAVLRPDGTTVAGPASPLPDGTPVVPGLTTRERLVLADAHDALPDDHEARDVIDGVLTQARHLA